MFLKSNQQQNPFNPPRIVCPEGTNRLCWPWPSSLGILMAWAIPGGSVSSSATTPCVSVRSCARWSALRHEPDLLAGAQTWLITRTLPYPLDSWLDQATISSLPSSLHLMCCSWTLVSEVLVLLRDPWPLEISHPLLHLDKLGIIQSVLQQEKLPLHEFKHHNPVFQ